MINETRQPDDAILMKKKRYSAPMLTDYGNVAQLTMSGNWDGADGNTTNCTGNAGGNPECGGYES